MARPRKRVSSGFSGSRNDGRGRREYSVERGLGHGVRSQNSSAVAIRQNPDGGGYGRLTRLVECVDLLGRFVSGHRRHPRTGVPIRQLEDESGKRDRWSRHPRSSGESKCAWAMAHSKRIPASLISKHRGASLRPALPSQGAWSGDEADYPGVACPLAGTTDRDY